jgi:hypothetical protein
MRARQSATVRYGELSGFWLLATGNKCKVPGLTSPATHPGAVPFLPIALLSHLAHCAVIGDWLGHSRSSRIGGTGGAAVAPRRADLPVGQ